MLLGALTSIDKSGLYGLSSRPVASSQQEQHNVILLSSCSTRFSTLPISTTQMSRYATPQPIPSQTVYNVSILLSSCSTRFSTLPISTAQMSRYATPQPIPSLYQLAHHRCHRCHDTQLHNLYPVKQSIM